MLLLSLEQCRNTEYARGLVLALCLWTDDVHGRLPGCCFVEEALEGSLSRLSQAAGTDLRATTVADFSDLYAALGPSRHEERDLTKPGMNRSFRFTVQARCRQFMQCCQRNVVKTVVIQRGQKYATVSAHAEGVVSQLPHRIVVPQLTTHDLHCCVVHAVLCLLRAKDAQAQTDVSEITRWAPALSTGDTVQKENMFNDTLLKLQNELPRSHAGVHDSVVLIGTITLLSFTQMFA